MLSALIELETLLEGSGSEFALKSYFEFLADTESSQFAAKIGAGMAHLYMDALGYVWRANAACLSSSLNPHADFIYDGGNVAGHGVVLAEAHGSFAKGVGASTIANAAKSKYTKQVKPYIAKPSLFGKVIHGYSIAFGSKPTAIGSFLAVSETRISKPRRRPAQASTAQSASALERTPASIALATHRSNFLLVGTAQISGWIDWLRSSDIAIPARDQVDFVRLQYAGRSYLTSMPWFWRYGVSPWWTESFMDNPDWWRIAQRFRFPASAHPEFGFGCFAIEENAGANFLNSLSGAIRSGERRLPDSMSLPTFEPVGFGLSNADGLEEYKRDEGYKYALFRDGLALLWDPFRGRHRGVVTWSPDGGIAL